MIISGLSGKLQSQINVVRPRATREARPARPGARLGIAAAPPTSTPDYLRRSFGSVAKHRSGLVREHHPPCESEIPSLELSAYGIVTT